MDRSATLTRRFELLVLDSPGISVRDASKKLHIRTSDAHSTVLSLARQKRVTVKVEGGRKHVYPWHQPSEISEWLKRKWGPLPSEHSLDLAKKRVINKPKRS